MFAKNCLGKELYDSLVDDLADYTSAVEWSGGTTTAGTTKKYYGVLYTALVTTTNEPSVKTEWKLADKFTTEKNNDLWCEALGRHLALLAYQNSFPAISTPTTGFGTVKKSGAGYDPATGADLLGKYHWIASQLVTSFENLEDYLVANGFNYVPCSKEEKCLVDGHYLFFSGGNIFIEDMDTTTPECSCGKCRARLLTQTNRYVIA